jgi:DNA polymerase-1
MTKRVLLIDADVIAYNAASACMQEIEFSPGYYTWQSSFEEVLSTFDAQIETIKETLDGDEIKLCLTDSEGNFRKAVLPTYKGKRGKKPLVLKALKEFLVSDRQAYFRPGLEGDDCMGILATVKSSDERIIVSIDKDMKQIPGKWVRWPDAVVTTIEPAEADYFHILQTLTGDVTDGYSGVPGIGPKKAAALLEPFVVEGKYPTFDNAAAWAAVVEVYGSKGLTEEDALVQARVARILRASDYDFKLKQPILWTP